MSVTEGWTTPLSASEKTSKVYFKSNNLDLYKDNYMCKKVITLREYNLLKEYFFKTQDYFKQLSLQKDKHRQIISMNNYYKRELQRKLGE